MTADVVLSDKEQEVVKRILAQHLSDLRFGISNAERFKFRRALQKDEAVIETLLARIEKG